MHCEKAYMQDEKKNIKFRSPWKPCLGARLDTRNFVRRDARSYTLYLSFVRILLCVTDALAKLNVT